MNSKYLTIKLLTGEEIVASFLAESEETISVMFPMSVKYLPKIMGNRAIEQITLAPYTYFAIDDEMTFLKSFIVFQKELNPAFIRNYENAVDDFIGHGKKTKSHEEPPASVDELKELTDKLESLFRNNIDEEDEIEEDKLFHTHIKSKHIH